jgi:ABC-type Zn uptake system ZnuABC Zn-binding protein ZnuA
MAAESFLADIAQHVAGDRVQVTSLIPAGADPHTYEPIPADLVRLSETQVIILNGAGFEAWMEPLLQNAPGDRLVIEASSGLTPRNSDSDVDSHATSDANDSDPAHSIDPHFWLDPLLAVRYVENIRDGLTTADPGGTAEYAQNAQTYIASLLELDAWIAGQVAAIPPERRLMVTNHESFGYYADRYGLTVVGTILPGTSSGAMPSAQLIVQLIDTISTLGTPAIFLETGSSPEMARQIAEQTGVQIILGLHTHSLSDQDGPASTYVDLMRHNTSLIVGALR